jgi:hypothetical protein
MYERIQHKVIAYSSFERPRKQIDASLFDLEHMHCLLHESTNVEIAKFQARRRSKRHADSICGPDNRTRKSVIVSRLLASYFARRLPMFLCLTSPSKRRRDRSFRKLLKA